MLTPPDDLPEDMLRSALVREWGLGIASLEYRAVGRGSHHWEVVGAEGGRWFVSVDDLATKRLTLADPLDAAYARLWAALGTARRLHEHGCGFVVAPIPTRDGEPLVRTGDRFGVAVYPYVDGESFRWAEWASPAHRRGVLDRVIAVHAAPAAARDDAPVDDFAIPHLDELEVGLAGTGDVPDTGPYARLAARLLVAHAAPVRRLLARHAELALAARARPGRMVLTHGEPHPGNTMRTADGWRLIDWDTVRVAPPERDLWLMESGDGSVLDAYAEATGVPPLPEMLELHRSWWHLADVAEETSRFRAPHTGTEDDDESFAILRSVLEHISALPAARV
ncbi:phosphotransferase [Plantactinospora sp. KLBMP9567]|uniref:phosphotransferase n=1 Tax=Plantactinospora sp. KLBMP9567 TaxID=3085900 RepID=UPI0029827A5F|nr:phosphotransferase [Plantactinospora sp. KLBMP9567]MDW5328151.1 phosphotransferase [Plantactinospora sp. KLBMP9567]